MQALKVAIPEPILPASTTDFVSVYDTWFDEVVRWVAVMGAAPADIEDLAQEVFLVVDRKLTSFDGQNLPGWLYGITRRIVAGHRRRNWVRSLFLRHAKELSPIEEPETPGALFERKQARELIEHVLSKMSDKRRRSFALFEIEGYSGEEIAALEGVPLKTIWTRLHHARKDFVNLASVFAGKERA
jgi:RNA polymerase sigma-70 factor (ECF subfamily)